MVGAFRENHRGRSDERMGTPIRQPVLRGPGSGAVPSRTQQTHKRISSRLLSILLEEFRLHPELLGPIRGPRANGDLLIEPNPDRDRDKMSALLKRILPLRHKAIAHIEVDPKIPDLEWEELDQAVLGVTEIFSIYSRRLTGVRYQVDDEGPQWKSWQRVFSEPLFPAGP